MVAWVKWNHYEHRLNHNIFFTLCFLLLYCFLIMMITTDRKKSANLKKEMQLNCEKRSKAFRSVHIWWWWIKNIAPDAAWMANRKKQCHVLPWSFFISLTISWRRESSGNVNSSQNIFPVLTIRHCNLQLE